jgi:nicotinamide riboside kinase
VAQRIAISGSAGVGKTTLASRLARVLGVPLVGEGMREYIETSGVDLHSIGWEGMRALVARLWDERREAEERAADGFVADRSSYDFAAFWLNYRFAKDDSQTDRLMEEALRGDRYDAVYVLAWGSIPLLADGVRTPDRWVQLQSQLSIEGCVRRYARRVVDVDAVGLDERVAAVLADLRGAR